MELLEPEIDEIVSIHAPARGATNSALRAVSRQMVSIHAPARGATYRPPVLDDLV